MNLRLKNKRFFKLIVFLPLSCVLVVSLYLINCQVLWNTSDYKILDLFYRQAIKTKNGPPISFAPQIIYLVINDATYNYFGKNHLDRGDLAKINNILSRLNPEAVVYDIIFANQSNIVSDQLFAESLSKLNSVYLPTALSLSEDPIDFEWGRGLNFEIFRSECRNIGFERGDSHPFYAKKAFLQYDLFAKAATGSGDISAFADTDGIYRHIQMLTKVDAFYYPSLSLSCFLDWARVPLHEIRVEWGKKITIPAIRKSPLKEDVVIPIDQSGKTFVPFINTMGKDFKIITADSLLVSFSDENLRGNLLELFEGNFVLITDKATGTSDMGFTPLESNASLATIHASMINGLLTNTFYTPWPPIKVLFLVWGICIILIISSLFRSPWFHYWTGFSSIVLLIGITWFGIVQFYLFPIVTSGFFIFSIFFIQVIIIAIVTFKDRAFIKNTFSKYVSQKVVTELLNSPDLIRIGGEERIATVLFSDIANFTSLSEKLTPTTLVGVLNEYFSEMSEIVFQQGGIIDKFQGDAIMAEFGIPVATNDHADRAVLSALNMQKTLRQLRQNWKKKGLPEFHCRIGINTDNMVVGNIGSPRIFDYTVIGDSVNLASRLEGANKLYGTPVLISQNTYEKLTSNFFKCRLVDFIIVKGKTEPIKIYEVYGLQKDNSSQEDELYYSIYHGAFEQYLKKNFSYSRNEFSRALKLRQNDMAAKLLIDRIDMILSQPQPIRDDWDGSVKLMAK